MSQPFALGTPGKGVRLVTITDADHAHDMLLAGEVAVPLDAIPAGPIALDAGGNVVPVEADAGEVLEAAWADVRRRRNALLQDKAWTFRADSPLTAEAQARWVIWAKKLNRLTIDYAAPEDVVWPEQPQIIYS